MRPLETIVCRDWLGFAGIESSRVLMIAREQQFAEKIHAYTLPRNAANSRVKDLVDLALLIKSGWLEKRRILDALHLTFDRRGTHDLPVALVPPPMDWQIPNSSTTIIANETTKVRAIFSSSLPERIKNGRSRACRLPRTPRRFAQILLRGLDCLTTRGRMLHLQF
jgi:hypothetical protein